MKKLLAASLSILALAGCSLPTSGPTKFERLFFDAQTNYVPHVFVVTNVVPVFSTQTVMQVEQRTNYSIDHQLVVQTVTVTNTVVEKTYQTNTVSVPTNVPVVTIAPGAGAQSVSTVGAVAGSPWGVGGLVGGGLSGIFAMWARYRNNQFRGQSDALTQTAGQLAQIIETGREVLKTTPQGQQADAAFKQWMISHQAQTGIISQVPGIIDQFVDNDEAKKAAEQIRLLLNPTAAKV